MKRRILSLALVVACFGGAQRPSPPEILAAAANKGRQVMEALRKFTYYAELSVETVSAADVITGRYYRFSQIYYEPDGSRREKLFEEKSSLPEGVHIGTNAAHNLMRIYQFFITPETLNQYEFNYVGRELIDEINTYVFDVKPKIKLPDPDKSPERYLKGRIWIDDQDLQVVKVAGQALPEQSDQRTPRFETYFQNRDGHWFPAYTYADDTIWVGRRRSRVIVRVKFTGYKKA
jgi:hypothetical protein